MVIEYFSESTGGWKSLVAEYIPDALDDCIRKKQAVFNEVIPRTYPKANPVAVDGWEVFPGMGRVDLVSWETENTPTLTVLSWRELAVRAAAQRNDDLDAGLVPARDVLTAQGPTAWPEAASSDGKPASSSS